MNTSSESQTPSHRPLLEVCDCGADFSRRQFLRNTATVAAGAVLAPALATAAAKKKADSETLVTTFYKSLTEEQRRDAVFPFDHELRSKVDNNWHITPHRMDKLFNADQQAMIREIFLGLHSPEYAEKVVQQVTHDSGKAGFGSSSVALFGTPGTGKFEFVLTGRHCTRRCDGDSVEGAAFGGPIFYGHAAESFNEKPTHPGNVYWFQALRANEVFKSLNGKQREMALLGDARGEKGTATVRLTGKKTGLPGIPLTELAGDQKNLVRKVMADLLAPFRKKDTTEAMKLIEKNGFDNLHMAFYKNEDVGKDGVWDVWQIEGPSMVWFFRGDPHVHVWVNIKDKA
ncbi:MAG: DUF3500 domain-containing protein [Verrucomicrobia bacterium]|nr:DUF3500 domain-containing protein [Verrucomicrobiota bacterium]